MTLVFPLPGFTHAQHMTISSSPHLHSPPPDYFEANSRHPLRCYFSSKVNQGEKILSFLYQGEKQLSRGSVG